MQITDNREQVLLGVQRLRAMAASSSSCRSPTSLNMELSIASNKAESMELPIASAPVQLELLPLRPSSQKASAGLNLWGLNFGTHTQSLRGSGIDVNQMPSSSDSDDEAELEGIPKLQLSGLVGSKRERACQKGPEADQERAFHDVSSRASDEEEGSSARKKLRLSKEQSALLEESFKEHSTLNPKQKSALAKQLNLRPRQVEVWFQNRRARTKLKQTEVDCELLKRCCESLTEENRRLQKEVAELRALKVGAPCVISHDFYMPLPAATLSMCPSCERLGPHAIPSASTTTAATNTASVNSLPFANKTHHFPLTFPSHQQPSAAC